MNRLAQYSGSAQIAVPAKPKDQTSLSADGTVVTQGDPVRRKLLASWQKLSSRLDDSWRAYLAPPNEVFVGEPIAATAIREKLQQYNAIATDSRYTTLANSAEFTEFYQQFTDYVTVQAPQDPAKLTLPPPPSRRY